VLGQEFIKRLPYLHVICYDRYRREEQSRELKYYLAGLKRCLDFLILGTEWH